MKHKLLIINFSLFFQLFLCMKYVLRIFFVYCTDFTIAIRSQILQLRCMLVDHGSSTEKSCTSVVSIKVRQHYKLDGQRADRQRRICKDMSRFQFWDVSILRNLQWSSIENHGFASKVPLFGCQMVFFSVNWFV